MKFSRFTLLITVLTLSVAVILSAAQKAFADSPNSLPSATITFTSVVSYDGTHSSEFCVVSGPFETLTFQAPCEPVAQQVMAQLQRDNPLVAFNVVINGKSLNTI